MFERLDSIALGYLGGLQYKPKGRFIFGRAMELFGDFRGTCLSPFIPDSTAGDLGSVQRGRNAVSEGSGDVR